jgi:hypothetical protein
MSSPVITIFYLSEVLGEEGSVSLIMVRGTFGESIVAVSSMTGGGVSSLSGVSWTMCSISICFGGEMVLSS